MNPPRGGRRQPGGWMRRHQLFFFAREKFLAFKYPGLERGFRGGFPSSRGGYALWDGEEVDGASSGWVPGRRERRRVWFVGRVLFLSLLNLLRSTGKKLGSPDQHGFSVLFLAS